MEGTWKSRALACQHWPRTLVLLSHASLRYKVRAGCSLGVQMHKTRCVGLLASVENNDETAVCSSGKLSFTKPRAAASGSFAQISFFNVLCLRVCCCLWLERGYWSASLPVFWVPLSLKDKMNCVEDPISSKATRVFSIRNLFYNNRYFSKYFLCPVMIFSSLLVFFFLWNLKRKTLRSPVLIVCQQHCSLSAAKREKEREWNRKRKKA